MTTTNQPDTRVETVKDHTTEEATFAHHFANFSDDYLITEFAKTKEAMAICHEWLARCEQELFRRMEERQAKAIPHPKFICEMDVANEYDYGQFTPLKELFLAADLEKVYKAATTKVVEVPEKWHTWKLLALARRYGAEALAVVERARFPGKKSLIFKAR